MIYNEVLLSLALILIKTFSIIFTERIHIHITSGESYTIQYLRWWHKSVTAPRRLTSNASFYTNAIFFKLAYETGFINSRQKVNYIRRTQKIAVKTHLKLTTLVTLRDLKSRICKTCRLCVINEPLFTMGHHGCMMADDDRWRTVNDAGQCMMVEALNGDKWWWPIVKKGLKFVPFIILKKTFPIMIILN